MSRRRSAALLVAAGIGLSIVVTWTPTASASVPPPSCKYSSNSTTEGAACGSGPAAAPYYRAYAICTSGQWVYGAWKDANSWQWSYANCATVGSSLQSGGSEWAFTH
jgi:hypothetical protein